MARISAGNAFHQMNTALKDRRLELSAAAMPPALHFQASTGTVAEVMLGAPPLGTLVGFHDRAIEIVLAPGDSVLLMTDGLHDIARGIIESKRDIAAKVWQESRAMFCHEFRIHQLHPFL